MTVIVPTKDRPSISAAASTRSTPARPTRASTSLLVDNGTTDPAALGLFERHPVEVLQLEGRFNFSRANNLALGGPTASTSSSSNNDTEVQTPEWLEVLVGLGGLDGVGAVGPLLVYPNGKVQHAGVVLGLRGTADHIMRGFPSDVDGYAGSLSCTREVSAVTAACMAVRRSLLESSAASTSTTGRTTRTSTSASGCARRACGTSSLRARSSATTRASRAARATTTSTARSSSTGGARRSSAATRTTTPRSRSPGTTTDRPHGVNVVFVNYQDFTSNSAVHIARLADELTAAGDECAVLVPGNPETVDAARRAPLPGARLRGTRGAGWRFRTAGRRRSCTPGRRARPSAS